MIGCYLVLQLSLNSEPAHKNPVPKNTIPNPFHLHTEVHFFLFHSSAVITSFLSANTNIFFFNYVRKEVLRKRRNFIWNFCRNSWKRKGPEFPRLIHILIQLTILWYSSLSIRRSINSTANAITVININLMTSHAGPTKTGTQAMYETRAIPT